MATVAERILEVIDEDVRPALESHGGGVEFVGFNESTGVLSVTLTGMCNGCPGAAMTMRNMVLGAVARKVPEVKEVVQA